MTNTKIIEDDIVNIEVDSPCWMTEAKSGRLTPFENVLGGVALILIVATVILSTLIITLEEPFQTDSFSSWLSYGMGILIIGFEACFVIVLAKRWGQKFLALEVAMVMPRLPILLRPLGAAFWLLHVFFGAGCAWTLTHLPFSGVFPMIIAAIGAWFIGCLTFGYVLLATSTIHRDGRILVRMWNHRMIVSAVISGLAYCMPVVGFITIGSKGVSITSENHGKNFQFGKTVAIPIHIRNNGKDEVKVLELGNALKMNLKTPDNAELSYNDKWFAFLLNGEDDYTILKPGQEIDAPEVIFDKGYIPDNWGPVGGEDTRLKPGRYLLTIRYKDKGGARHAAITDIDVCVIRFTIGRGLDEHGEGSPRP